MGLFSTVTHGNDYSPDSGTELCKTWVSEGNTSTNRKEGYALDTFANTASLNCLDGVGIPPNSVLIHSVIRSELHIVRGKRNAGPIANNCTIALCAVLLPY
jgi:hypothetical protein